MYFLHITIPRLKIKNPSTKNKANHQNDAICFRKICNKTGDCDCQQNIKKNIDDGSAIDATAVKKTIGDGLIKTTVASTTAVIFFGLKLVCKRQGNVLLTSTSLGWFISLPAWEMRKKILYHK